MVYSSPDSTMIRITFWRVLLLAACNRNLAVSRSTVQMRNTINPGNTLINPMRRIVCSCLTGSNDIEWDGERRVCQKVWFELIHCQKGKP